MTLQRRTRYTVYGATHPAFFAEPISRHRWWITAVIAAWWWGLTVAHNGSWIVKDDVTSSLPIARINR